MISNITVKNIKGYGDPPVSLDVEIKPDKVNLLIAPNGFGKSSLACAFNCLKQSKLVVDKEDKYRNDENLLSELSVTIDGSIFSASENSNNISSFIEPVVINTRTKVHTFGRNTGEFQTVSGYLDIEDIELYGRIPEPTPLQYKVSNITMAAGAKRGIISNNPLFSNDDFISFSGCILSELDKFSAKKRRQLINDIWTTVNSRTGNVRDIISGIPDNIFTLLESEPCYQIFLERFEPYLTGKPKFEVFSLFYQLLVTYETDKNAYKKAVSYSNYKIQRARIDQDLILLNSSWNEIKTSVNDGKLVIHFPRANQMSNGQRDVLTLVCELIKFRSKVRRDKKYLLIIDEVFDYLDDANIMAAQYFLSNLTAVEGVEIYVCLLTHLSTDFFRSYVFSKKKINEVFLKSVRPDISTPMKKYIAFREGLDRKNNQQDNLLYNDISKYFLHYSPDDKDISAELESRHIHGLKTTWGKKSEFKKYVIQELNKYLIASDDYDPYAVAIALRIKCEKECYEQLNTQELRSSFINEEWKTVDKFDFCERAGLVIPSSFYIVAAIHNESDHVKTVGGVIKDTPMVYKLQNEVIQNVMRELFRFDGTPVPEDCF